MSLLNSIKKIHSIDDIEVIKMSYCPYTNGDLVKLQHGYEILSCHSQTETYWIFDAVNSETKKKVVIKVFINEGFTSIEETRTAWISEIENLQTQAEYQGLPINYIESEEKSGLGKTQFIIVFSYVKDEETPEISPERIESAKDKEIEGKADEMVLKKTDDFVEAVEAEAELAEEPAVASPKPSRRESVPLKKAKQKIAEIEEFEEAEELEELMEEPEYGGQAIEIADDSMELEEDYESEYLKQISMEYFDRMNPQNYYPMTISISDIIEAKKAAVVNPITGERKVQKQTEIQATLKDPIVTIRPTIPGCSVVPSVIDTDFSFTKDTVTFYITPGVKGEILGNIEFLNEGKVIYSYDFEAKVVDPRYARVVAFYGILTSFLPKIITLLGVDLWLGTTLNDLWGVAENTVGNMSIASLIAIGGIIPVLLLSFGVSQRLKPKSSKIQYKLSDFRLKGLKLKKIP
ncbi:MAG: hypothetical protein E3J70_04040 [Candidatus Heimdallarchaeota archaeon]|nr:MAG: hypothetical protein E3J70_04040 [Candidatus Heimdallarchaeota archaeon]